MLTIEAIGQGRPILYLHGWGFDSQIWHRQVDFFRSGYRNCVVDYNLRDLPPEITYDTLLDHLCTLILERWDDPGTPPYSVFASGFGAFLAYELIERGVRPACLVLFGGPVRFTNDERYLSGLPPHQVSAMRRRLHQHPRAMLGDYYRLAFSGDGERAPQDLLAAPPTHALEFLKLAFDTLITHDFQELLPDLAVRSLIVQGDSDRLTPVWQAQLLRRLIGDAELWLCRGGGHLPFVTRYAHLNRRISRFLDDAGGEAPPAVMPAR
ncbi:MAG: alpha/beta hydrolase [SAR324 cluster bacterium]|nr:alpha/beta hydrolase [SAR324 cluster bacterium]